jgi:hypothetical protein
VSRRRHRPPLAALLLGLVAAKASAEDAITSRWLDLQAADVGARFRYVDPSAGPIQRQGQYNNAYRARLKLDAQGRYAVGVGIATSGTITASWNNSGIGTAPSNSDFAVRQLYLAARPVEGIEAQYGSFGVLHGESTEITSYDNDVYIAGERVSLRRPKDLFLDELSVTYAYLGDTTTPGVAKRWRRLGQSNYHQFLLEKRLGKRTAVSADYTFQSGIETLRQGVHLDTKGWTALDGVRLETYERVDVKPDHGFALIVEKSLLKHLALAPGWANIDASYTAPNSDSFGRGQRVFLIASLSLTPELRLSTFYTHAVHHPLPGSNRARLEVALRLNGVKALQRSPRFGHKEPAG